MSSSEEIRQLSEQVLEFAPPAAERRPSTFLSLAPSTSESYPRIQRQRQPLPVNWHPCPTCGSNWTGNQAAQQKKRRSSSASSEAGGFRFLKLGPVHWGEHQEEHQDDFHEVAVE
ncbi:hypothetical protein N0V88_003936 [Collariella sp. IMI 366227]|nr:hypothetical protein N0V88_003936 [Collariella sp. IMI 366227]